MANMSYCEILKVPLPDLGSIWEIFAGAIVGYFLPELVKVVKKSYKRSLLKEEFEDFDEIATLKYGNFLPLDHGIPAYNYQDIILDETKKRLFFNIPIGFHEHFKRHKFEVRIEESGMQMLIQSVLKKLNIQNSIDLVDRCINQAASDFLEELEAGHNRFNGLMYGVYNVAPKRLTNDEMAGLILYFHKTDYFSYRVLSYIHARIGKELFKISQPSDINKYVPFSSSFGLGIFLLINRGQGEEVLIGRRSNGVLMDGGKWHFTMNEAFSTKDVDEHGKPSLASCLYRGLKEELGITELFKRYATEFAFLDFAMLTDRFELGMTGYVRLRFDKTYTYQNFLNLYEVAPDRRLETETLTPVPVKEIKSFIKDNYHDINDGCRGGLELLVARFDAGYLWDESALD